MFKTSAFFSFIALFACLIFSGSSLAIATEEPPVELFPDDSVFRLEYRAVLDPQIQGAQVTMQVDRGELLRKVNFSNKKNIYSSIKANGKLVIKDDHVYWDLPKGKATLSYRVKLTHERDPGEFDSLINQDWAIFRGDDLIPAMHVIGYFSDATLEVVLPKGWNSIETGWPRKKDNIFRVDNPERIFDRPTGWMIAGKIATRRAKVAKTTINVSAPKGQSFQRMDTLTFLNFVWPDVDKAFKATPDKLLVVGSGDPMWRGGLSASNSLFLHADRPLVSENGTSPLLHELTHMITRISGVKTEKTNDDWIAEGLAEFYSIELLYRANGISKARRAAILKGLNKWGKEVKHLRKSKSTGAMTARAVTLLAELDKELRQRSANKYNIDDVTRVLMQKRKVSLDDLRSISESLIGAPLKTLNSPLLR